MLFNKLNIKNVINYTLYSLLDRCVNFALPLLFLTYLNSKTSFNTIEYVFSLGILISIFADFGIKSYCIYGYLRAGNGSKLLNELDVNIASICLILFISFISLKYFHASELILFVLSRLSYLTVYNYLIYRFRASDQPVFAYYFSLSTNIIVIIYTLIFKGRVDDEILLTNIFYAYLLIPLFYSNYLAFNKKTRLLESYSQLTKALNYSWPIMISSSLSLFIMHYTKIYAFNALTETDMTILSLTQRFSLIVQILHSIYCGYLNKKMMSTSYNQYQKETYLPYLFFLIAGGFVSIITLYLYFVFFTDIKFNYLIALLSITSTMIWCITAYNEVAFNKVNKNKYILLANFAGVIIYTAYIYSSNLGLIQLLAGMLFAMFTTLLFQLICLKHVQKKIN